MKFYYVRNNVYLSISFFLSLIGSSLFFLGNQNLLFYGVVSQLVGRRELHILLR